MILVKPADSATSTNCEKGGRLAGSRARALRGTSVVARTPGTERSRRRRDHLRDDLDVVGIVSMSPSACSPIVVGPIGAFMGQGLCRLAPAKAAAPARCLGRWRAHVPLLLWHPAFCFRWPASPPG